MKELFSIALFAVAAICGAVGCNVPEPDARRSLDRQDGCNTASDAFNAIIAALEECGMPDMVILM